MCGDLVGKCVAVLCPLSQRDYVPLRVLILTTSKLVSILWTRKQLL